MKEGYVITQNNYNTKYKYRTNAVLSYNKPQMKQKV